MTIGRRLTAALRMAVSDPGAWPAGMLGFLVRGGLVVLALPILTLPTPVGVATLLGPAVISTGRLDGPLRSLLVGAGVVLAALLAGALLLAALAQHLVHTRWRLPGARPAGVTVRGLVGVELVAITPIVLVVVATMATIVDEVRGELLLPGDLAVPFAARVVVRMVIPLGALAAAIVVAEAIDGSLARRILLPRRRDPSVWRALMGVVATAVLAWLATLVVLVPGVAVIGATWEAVRVAWSRLPPAEATSPDVILAVVAVVAMIAVWLGVLLLCGIASIVRAHLWTTRAGAGDWTSIGH